MNTRGGHLAARLADCAACAEAQGLGRHAGADRKLIQVAGDQESAAVLQIIYEEGDWGSRKSVCVGLRHVPQKTLHLEPHSLFQAKWLGIFGQQPAAFNIGMPAKSRVSLS